MTLGRGEQHGFFGAIELEDRAQHAGMAEQVCTQRDVFDHAHVGNDLDMLEGAAEPELRRALRRLRLQRMPFKLDAA